LEVFDGSFNLAERGPPFCESAVMAGDWRQVGVRPFAVHESVGRMRGSQNRARLHRGTWVTRKVKLSSEMGAWASSVSRCVNKGLRWCGWHVARTSSPRSLPVGEGGWGSGGSRRRATAEKAARLGSTGSVWATGQETEVYSGWRAEEWNRRVKSRDILYRSNFSCKAVVSMESCKKVFTVYSRGWSKKKRVEAWIG
jgi:hypothetical protein